MKILRNLQSEKGSTLVLSALDMIIVVAFIGLAIDVGNARFFKRHLQSAVDAAAIAAALEIPSCNGVAACPAMLSAARASFSENGFASVTIATNCAKPTAAGLTVVIDNPPCSQGSTDPNAGKTNYVEVLASQTQQNIFAGLVGVSSFPVSVRAESERTANPNCIYALDPTAGNAITVDVLATVQSSCGIVDESSAWNALSCSLIASVTAPSLEVVGNADGLLCLLPSTRPRTGIPLPSPADPLSYLTKPAVPSCGTSTGLNPQIHGSSSALVLALGSYTLYPDQAYCGGIVISGANVTFTPGTYVIKSNGLFGAQGGLVIGPMANVTGNGVTFYNYGPKGSISFLASTVNLGKVTLTAPTSGPYSCVLFYQDPQNVDPASFLVSADWNAYLEGAYYFPGTNLLYAASLPVNYNVIVAKDIEFAALTFGKTLKTSINNNYSSLSNYCLAGGGSELVQ